MQAPLRFGWRREWSAVVACAVLAFATLLGSAIGCRADGGDAFPNAAREDRPSKALVPPEPVETPTTAPAPSIDDVVLITIDALRADQPWVGYGDIDTPHLSKLAERSLVYTRAYGLANITTASLSGMLASHYPSELAREGCIFGKYDLDGSLAPYLSSLSVVTLAAQGQAVFVGRIAPSLGFRQWRLVKGIVGRPQSDGAVVGAEVADLLIEYLNDARIDGQKRFLWAHFPDPHDTYVAHAAFPPKSQSLRARYDSEVAYTDAAIGRVLDAIASTGRLDRTAIIVTADHGEAFGEHGTQRHGFTLFEEEIRVPLLVYWPRAGHRIIDTPRSTIDVAPTIVELLGHAVPSGWRGKSLLFDAESEHAEARTVIVDLPEMRGRAKMQAVIADGMKIVFTASGASVFDLIEDPKERAPIPKNAEPAKAAVAAARPILDGLAVKKPTVCNL